MGLLKFVGKTLGTATLVVTGVTTTVLKGVSDTVGFEIGSNLLGMAKDASFNGIRSMWSEKDLEGGLSKVDNMDQKIQQGSYSQMARTAKQAAETAKKQADIALRNGDSEKYQICMEKYEHYMSEYERYK
jgi:3-oxoacyl-ACP reductase-like protein